MLRNHSGTCIDLAIFWASACESVSLQTALVVTKDHCFPVVRLPQGGTLAIEATGIVGMSFEEAVKLGTKEVEQLKDRADLATFVDIMQLRHNGVQPIDLPKASDTYLTDLGYQFAKRPAAFPTTTPVATKPEQTASTSTTPTSQPADGSLPAALAGTWTGTVRGPQGSTIAASLTLKSNGTMTYVFEARYYTGETKKMEGTGQWKVSERSLVMSDKDGVNYYPFELKDNQLSLFVANIGIDMNLVRTQG